MSRMNKSELDELMEYYTCQIKPYGVSADKEDIEYFIKEYERLTGMRPSFI